MESSENKYGKGMIIIVVILWLVVLGLGGWILYDKVINKDTTKEEPKQNEVEKPSGGQNQEEANNDETDDAKEILEEYKDDSTFLFEHNNYKVYKLKCSKASDDIDSLYSNCYEDEKDKELYYLYGNKQLYYAQSMYTDDGESKDYYVFSEVSEEPSDEMVGMLILSAKKVITGYQDYSCGFHSDFSAALCKSDRTTLLQDKNDKFGIYSFVSNKIILPVEYDTIFNVEDGKYLIEKNGKYGLIDENINYLLKLEYDYIGYNEKIGYIVIKDSNIKLYDNNLKEKDVNKLKDLYESALIKNDENITYNVVYLDNSNSFYWESGSYLIKADINKVFNVNNDDENYFKYNGTKFSGEQLFIYDQFDSCNDNAKIYVINNNKVEVINSNEITASTSCW